MCLCVCAFLRAGVQPRAGSVSVFKSVSAFVFWSVFWAKVCKTVRPMLSVRCLSVCLSVTFVHCGQTVGRIKMKLGTQIGLGPDHIVLDGDPALPLSGGASVHHIAKE